VFNRSHGLLKIAKELGINIRKADWNKSKIPHLGKHIEDYFDAVEALLDRLIEFEWTKETLEDALQNIVHRILLGDYNLYK
jgi:hypothetical protein